MRHDTTSGSLPHDHGLSSHCHQHNDETYNEEHHERTYINSPNDFDEPTCISLQAHDLLNRRGSSFPGGLPPLPPKPPSDELLLPVNPRSESEPLLGQFPKIPENGGGEPPEEIESEIAMWWHEVRTLTWYVMPRDD